MKQLSNSVVLGWDLRICLSKKFPVDIDAVHALLCTCFFTFRTLHSSASLANPLCSLLDTPLLPSAEGWCDPDSAQFLEFSVFTP